MKVIEACWLNANVAILECGCVIRDGKLYWCAEHDPLLLEWQVLELPWLMREGATTARLEVNANA